MRFWKGAWWVFVNHQGKRKEKRIGDRETAQKVAKAIRARLAAGISVWVQSMMKRSTCTPARGFAA